MKNEERMQRYFRTKIYNNMTQVRYFSKKICVEIFSESAQKSGKAPPPFRCSIECILFKINVIQATNIIMERIVASVNENHKL